MRKRARPHDLLLSGREGHRRSPERRLALHGRYGGENIYPVQIEDFLRRHNKIKDAAVIGLPDRRLGEKTAAVIEIKAGVNCTEEEIADFCLELPRYKRPKEFIFHEIPRNATGKIEKPKLRKMYNADQLVARENRG